MYNRSKWQKQIGCSVGKGIGHFFGAMQIDGFIDKDEFKKQIDEWIQVFRKQQARAWNKRTADSRRSGKKSRSDQEIPIYTSMVDLTLSPCDP